jgi:hypothetical protein
MRLPRRCRGLKKASGCSLSLAGQVGVSEPFAVDLHHGQREAVRVIQRIIFGRPIIEPENLLRDIAVKVERFHGHVRSAQSSLEQRPEVLDALSVNLSANYSSTWFTVSWTNCWAAGRRS